MYLICVLREQARQAQFWLSWEVDGVSEKKRGIVRILMQDTRTGLGDSFT
jgi:hypothetical protein